MLDRRSFVGAATGGVAAWMASNPVQAERIEYSPPLRRRWRVAIRAHVHEVDNEYLLFESTQKAYEIHPKRHMVIVKHGMLGNALGGLGDGPGRFNLPVDVAFDMKRRMYVVDQGNSRIQVFSSGGRYDRHIGGYGAKLGQLNLPCSLAIRGDLCFVCDTLNHRIQVFCRKGHSLGSFGRHGSTSGYFNGPRSIAVGTKGELHVVDGGNARVQVFTQRGRYRFSYGHRGTGVGAFEYPRSIVVDRRGVAYVADASLGVVQAFFPNGKPAARFLPSFRDGSPAMPVYLALDTTSRLHISAQPMFRA